MTTPKRSLEQILERYGPVAGGRLAPFLRGAGFDGLPNALRLLAFKAEGWLELWGRGDGQEEAWRPIRRYRVLAASGGPGPKLREGDRQVPEGRYPLTFLNPNSAYHLSIRIGYPSAEDLAQAREEGRSDLGGDIMIHGGARSVGCLAVGDAAIEELFVLTAAVGLADSEILIVPVDLRQRDAEDPRSWVQQRYDVLRENLGAMPKAVWPKEKDNEGE